ncbi:rhomboid family intramembrane serine protease [Staphylococcus aureus]
MSYMVNVVSNCYIEYFQHFSFEHILMNMLSLFIFGKIVEAIIGSWRMLACILYCRVVWSLYHYHLIRLQFQLGLVVYIWFIWTNFC